MDSITLEELEKKIKTGESIEEIAKKHWVRFNYKEERIPENMPVEKLVEIIEQTPELLTKDYDIPAWVFLLLLVKEKFDIVNNVVCDIFGKTKKIVCYKEEDISNIIVCNTFSTIKQVTKEQISVLLSIMEKRKNLFSKYSKDKIANLLIKNFLEPIYFYISEECFLLLFDWVSKETGSYFFKNIDYYFFDHFSVKSQFVQEKLVNYFISAHPAWLFNPDYRKMDLFIKKEKLKKINIEIFISSVVKSFSKLSDIKKVYLLNFPYFIENYPHLAVKSLKAFVYDSNYYSKFILDNNKIFIPNNIWDIVSKEDSPLLLSLIKWLPYSIFYFDIDYVSNKASVFCFIAPENRGVVQTRLKVLKGLFSETTAYKIIKEIKYEASTLRLFISHNEIANVVKFVLDRLPSDVAFWILRIMLPSVPSFDEYGEEKLEYDLGDIKTQMQEVATYLKEVRVATSNRQSGKLIF